jgi:hypothetical protein
MLKAANLGFTAVPARIPAKILGCDDIRGRGFAGASPTQILKALFILRN